jgi:5'-nucleotidase
MTKTLDATPEIERNRQRIVYVDMDDTLCDYTGAYRRTKAAYPGLQYPQSEPGFYLNLEPIAGAIDGFQHIGNLPCTEVYILTAPSVMNPHSYSEKRLWVERHLGLAVAYRLILSPNKGLLRGDILIDDNRSGKGQEYFQGTIYQFGSKRHPDWTSIAGEFKT